MITGVIERLLFITPIIVLLRMHEITALVAIISAYTALKGVVWKGEAGRGLPVSLQQSVWGTGVSMGFAVFAGWLYWHILDP